MLLQFFMIIKLSFFHWIARARFNSLKQNKFCSEPKRSKPLFWNLPKESQGLLKQWSLNFGLETMSSEARRQAKMGYVFHFILLAQIKCMTFATACKFLLILCFNRKMQAVKAVL
tara:strand:+ start:1404 stop:1748 length:345 start_codon:yes stop_codon:yes gene_type:complete